MSTPLEQGHGHHNLAHHPAAVAAAQMTEVNRRPTPTAPALAFSPTIAEAVAHLCLGSCHLTIRRDRLAASGYMLRDASAAAVFGGTFADCMEEAGRLLHDHLAKIGAAR